MSRPGDARRTASRWLLVACVPALFALGCEEGARTGSVYRVRVPYGPWWVYPTVYDRPLALGRPKVVAPPSAETSASAKETAKYADETLAETNEETEETVDAE